MIMQNLKSTFIKWLIGLILFIGLFSSSGLAYRNVSFKSDPAKTELVGKLKKNHKPVSYRKIAIDRNNSIYDNLHVQHLTTCLEESFTTQFQLNRHIDLNINSSSSRAILFIGQCALSPVQESSFISLG